jgi:TPR repeat protein
MKGTTKVWMILAVLMLALYLSRQNSPETKPDLAKAVRMLVQECNLGRTDPVTSVADCRQLAERGDANAQYVSGIMFYTGVGMPKDRTEALNWYRKAANQGYANAQSELGWMYNYGEGVPRDYRCSPTKTCYSIRTISSKALASILFDDLLRTEYSRLWLRVRLLHN